MKDALSPLQHDRLARLLPNLEAGMTAVDAAQLAGLNKATMQGLFRAINGGTGCSGRLPSVARMRAALAWPVVENGRTGLKRRQGSAPAPISRSAAKARQAVVAPQMGACWKCGVRAEYHAAMGCRRFVGEPSWRSLGSNSGESKDG